MTPDARELLDVLFATLWQGACIVLAVAAVLAATGRRLNAATRSIIWQVALAAIVIVAIGTTLPNIMSHGLSLGGHAVPGSAAAVTHDSIALAAPRRIDVVLGDRTVDLLIAAWIGGTLAFTLRLGVASLQVGRLARRSIRLPDRGGVRVYASPDVGVPLATGFAAPAVIVPTALAAQGGEEFQCIVLHELAHVRRGDAWVNACERMLHAFLFFNPAVSIVLGAIALEREAACDDWAAAQSRDLETYTRSLASFALRRAGAAQVAPCAASGFGRATVTRIRRLEDARRNGAITLSHYALGGFTLMLLVLALTLQSFAPAIAFAPQPVTTSALVASTACSKAARYLTGPPPHVDRPVGLKAEALVHLTATGQVMSAAISKSSRNAAFDRAVLDAAKKGTYAPEVENCKPVAGSYLFDAQTTS